MAEDRNVPGISINIADYTTGKASGTAKIVKMNGALYYTQKRFDPNTGSPTPALVGLDRKSVEDIIASMEKDLSNVKMILTDMDDAKEIMP